MNNRFLKKLQSGIILGAEGYIYELERRGYVKAGPYTPEVVLDHPEALEQLHTEFLRAGAEVMVALTYYAHREKLKQIGKEGQLEELNRKAIRIAKKVAKKGNALVAGNICNTWVYDPDQPKKSGEKVRAMYKEQISWATDEGVDLIIAETIEYLGEALIALEVIKEFNLPAVVTLAPTDTLSRDGYKWEVVCKKLEEAGADVVGLNCIQGPETIFPLLKKIRETVKCPIAAQPVPYHTTPKHKHFQYLRDKNNKQIAPYNLESHLLNRDEMAEFAKKAKELGINYIGICCGGAPHHVRAMAEALGRTVPASTHSPDLTKHAQLGDKKHVNKHVKSFTKNK